MKISDMGRFMKLNPHENLSHDRYAHRGSHVTKYSGQACVAHCKNRKHSHPNENIDAVSFDGIANKCYCTTAIKTIADTTKQGCHLIPTRLSKRCNVVSYFGFWWNNLGWFETFDQKYSTKKGPIRIFKPMETRLCLHCSALRRRYSEIIQYRSIFR